MTDTYVAGGQRRKYFLISGEFSQIVRASFTEPVPATHNPTDVTGDETNSAGIDRTSDLIKWYSGEFSSTIKSSIYIGGAPLWRSNPHGLTCDVTNTGTGGISASKVTTWSGKVTSTIKTSYHIGAPGAPGMSWDIENTMYCQYTVMYLMSGQYTSTIKSSIATAPHETNMGGISWNWTDTITAGEGTGDMLLKWSGRFTSTIKASNDFTFKDGNPRGIDTWDMTQRMEPTSFPNIDVSPLTVDFEDTYISTVEEKTVTISNIGTAFLTVTAVATTSAYYTVAGLSTYVASGLVKAFSIPPSGSTIFTVIHTPVTTDVETGFVGIVNDDPNETYVEVYLTGYGSNLPPMEGTQNFTLYIDQQRIQDRYISQGRSFTGYVDQARNFDLEL